MKSGPSDTKPNFVVERFHESTDDCSPLHGKSSVYSFRCNSVYPTVGGKRIHMHALRFRRAFKQGGAARATPRLFGSAVFCWLLTRAVAGSCHPTALLGPGWRPARPAGFRASSTMEISSSTTERTLRPVGGCGGGLGGRSAAGPQNVDRKAFQSAFRVTGTP